MKIGHCFLSKVELSHKPDKLKRRKKETNKWIFTLKLWDGPYKAWLDERNLPFVLDRSNNPQIIPEFHNNGEVGKNKRKNTALHRAKKGKFQLSHHELYGRISQVIIDLGHYR